MDLLEAGSSVDTTMDCVDTLDPVYTALVIDGVDTSIDDMVKCVDTALGSVNTRPSSQETQLPDWDRVSTQSLVVSTLDPSPRRPFLDNWDSVSTHSVVVSTHSG
ncbi:hypothetical protein Taro_016660 [Colocasia esculenta]|uniref:Uncharacterized protein n=1 Tax=Colocasia esculenta TaxID=4460 RepID=A0A843UQY3_COLES|nr:hypothetical protein [Colocasia esculenta]